MPGWSGDRPAYSRLGSRFRQVVAVKFLTGQAGGMLRGAAWLRRRGGVRPSCRRRGALIAFAVVVVGSGVNFSTSRLAAVGVAGTSVLGASKSRLAGRNEFRKVAQSSRRGRVCSWLALTRKLRRLKKKRWDDRRVGGRCQRRHRVFACSWKYVKIVEREGA